MLFRSRHDAGGLADHRLSGPKNGVRDDLNGPEGEDCQAFRPCEVHEIHDGLVLAFAKFYRRKRQRPSHRCEGLHHSIKSGGDLLSQGVYPQVPSALAGLTAVFGMGTGVSPPLWPPEICCQGDARRVEPQALQSKHEHKSKPSAD